MQDQFKNYPKDYISNLKNAIKAAEEELDNVEPCACDEICPSDAHLYPCENCVKEDEIITGILNMKREAGLL